MITHNRAEPSDVMKAWTQIERKLRTYTPEQARQSLIDSGILTKSGNVAKPYKEVFKPAGRIKNKL